jgi:hypothetical protein
VLNKELGEGSCIEFIEAKSKQSLRVDQSKIWEKLLMQVEEDFDHETGDAQIEVKVSMSGESKESQAAKIVASAAPKKTERNKGSNARDNPDSYDFIFDCSLLGPGWTECTINADPEILWHDFREMVTTQFGAPVSISYMSIKGKVLPLKSEDDFNNVCDQIEDEWDDADGDGSVRCVLQPPQGGMPAVKAGGGGARAALLRVAVSDERGRLQLLATQIAARMRERNPVLCSALLDKESAAMAGSGTVGSSAAAAANFDAEIKGVTAEQTLKIVYSKVLGKEYGEDMLQTLEKLVLDDDMLLALQVC